MRRLACHLALAACGLAGSVAHAAPARAAKVAAAKSKHRAKPVADDTVTVTDDDVDADADADAPPPPKHKHAHPKAKPHKVAAEDVEPADVDADVDIDLVAVAPPRGKPAADDWHVAIGPYAWASAVDASVSVGGKTVDPSGIHFAKLDHSIKYGGELVGEARYDRFSLTGDVIFGAIGIDAGTEASGLMVNVHGDVSALLADGAGGVRVLGDDHSVVALEARGGIRYQRVAVRAAVGVDGAVIAPPEIVFAGADAVAGGRIFVRPSHRFFFTGMADIGLFGASASTWSVTADASVRLGSHVQLSLGWRTLALDRTSVNLVLQGPRAVVQLLL